MNTSNGNRFEGRAILKLVAEDGTELCNRPLAIDPDKTWCEYTGQLTATGSDPHARFVIELEGTGTLLLDYVSLFPETFRNRINGLRKDIAQTLEALHPAFVRWPGGCIVEGIDLSNRIEWKRRSAIPRAVRGSTTRGDTGPRWDSGTTNSCSSAKTSEPPACSSAMRE